MHISEFDKFKDYINIIQKPSVNELLLTYKELIDIKDQTQRGNLKFVESYVGYVKKRLTEWEDEAIWFVKQAIILHMDTFGKRRYI